MHFELLLHKLFRFTKLCINANSFTVKRCVVFMFLSKLLYVSVNYFSFCNVGSFYLKNYF